MEETSSSTTNAKIAPHHVLTAHQLTHARNVNLHTSKLQVRSQISLKRQFKNQLRQHVLLLPPNVQEVHTTTQQRMPVISAQEDVLNVILMEPVHENVEIDVKTVSLLQDAV